MWIVNLHHSTITMNVMIHPLCPSPVRNIWLEAAQHVVPGLCGGCLGRHERPRDSRNVSTGMEMEMVLVMVLAMVIAMEMVMVMVNLSRSRDNFRRVEYCGFRVNCQHRLIFKKLDSLTDGILLQRW